MKNTNKKNAQTSNKSRRRHIYGRFLVMTTILVFVSGLCIASMVSTTVVNAEHWRMKGDTTFSDTITTSPLRGDILASDGSILATNLSYYNMRIDFRAPRFNVVLYHDSCLNALADSMAHYHPFRTVDEWREYLKKPLKDSVHRRSRGFLLLKHATFEEKERIKKFPYFKEFKKVGQSGLIAERVLVRSYPYGDMARLSIGRVGETEYSTEVRGRSGLERTLDTLLFGQKGKASRREKSGAYENYIKPQDGITVKTTIDITIQDILESELEKMVLESRAEWGCAMIMDVETGDIKAISNLDLDSANNRCIESRNHIVRRYEPGSVIKVISMIPALEDKYAPLDKVYKIGYAYNYAGGSPIRDSHSPGELRVRDFIEYSSNIGMTKLITPQFENNLNGFRDRLAQFGFFDRLNSGLEQEMPPLYPTLDPKAGGRVSLARMAYGYSTLVPPLYTCAIYNAIANDGKFVRPRLIESLHYPDGTDSIIPVSYVRDRICSSENARILREMIHSVVWGEHGTAKGVRNDKVEIAGKTGTAYIAIEVAKDENDKPIKGAKAKGGYTGGKRYAFCGFFPYDNPKYTCIVLIQNPRNGQYGSANRSSGAVLREVALKLYSRGLLDNNADYTDKPAEKKRPTLYSSTESGRYQPLGNDLYFSSANVIKTPETAKSGCLPDVKGLGIREALVKLESLGLDVNFNGTGYVTSMTPPVGTPIKPNMVVNVILSQN